MKENFMSFDLKIKTSVFFVDKLSFPQERSSRDALCWHRLLRFWKLFWEHEAPIWWCYRKRPWSRSNFQSDGRMLLQTSVTFARQLHIFFLLAPRDMKNVICHNDFTNPQTIIKIIFITQAVTAFIIATLLLALSKQQQLRPKPRE